MHTMTAPNGTRFEWEPNSGYQGSKAVLCVRVRINPKAGWHWLPIADLLAFASEYDAVSKLKPPPAEAGEEAK